MGQYGVGIKTIKSGNFLDKIICCSDQFFLTTLFIGKSPGGSLPVPVPLLSPVTHNLFFLNQLKKETAVDRAYGNTHNLDRQATIMRKRDFCILKKTKAQISCAPRS